jgi:hypothetical protein
MDTMIIGIDKIGYGKRVVVSTKDSHVGGVVHEIGKGSDR